MGGIDEREMSLTIRLPALGEILGSLVKEREMRHTPYDSRMIARMWNGRARPEHADAYVTHLQQKTFPQLASIPGHHGAYILRRAAAGGIGLVEFTVITLWESLDAITRFAGADPELAVVPPEAQSLLASYDDRAVHWEVAGTGEDTLCD
jgi:heme-degrading monooxygenase HmoA